MSAGIVILIFFTVIIIFSCIMGEIRFKYLKKQKEKEEAKKEKERNSDFYRNGAYRINVNCCNSETGAVCVKCGRCGRKF